MTWTLAALNVLAPAASDSAMKGAGTVVGFVLFIVLIVVAPIYLIAKKGRKSAGNAFYRKLAIGGFVGLACAYSVVRITAQNRPDELGANPSHQTSRERQSRTPEQEEADGQRMEQARLENERRLQQMRELREAERAQEREQRERGIQQQREEREARLAQQQAEREAAQAQQQATQAAEQVQQQEVDGSIGTRTAEQLQQERDLCKVELDAAVAAMRAANARDSGATPQERQAASKRFSEAVKAHAEASRALADKLRQRR